MGGLETQEQPGCLVFSQQARFQPQSWLGSLSKRQGGAPLAQG